MSLDGLEDLIKMVERNIMPRRRVRLSMERNKQDDIFDIISNTAMISSNISDEKITTGNMIKEMNRIIEEAILVPPKMIKPEPIRKPHGRTEMIEI